MTKMQLVFVLYLVAIHALLAIVLWKSNFIGRTTAFLLGERIEIKPHFHTMLNVHLQQLDSIPDKATIFIGDSHVQGLCVSAVTPVAINFGISGDTTVGVIRRLKDYSPVIPRAEFVVLAIGVNDLYFREPVDIEKNVSAILDDLAGAKVLLSSIFPIDESANKHRSGQSEKIQSLNVAFARLANKRANVRFLDNTSVLDSNGDGVLDKGFHTGDGLHLSSSGYSQWIGNLRDEIGRWRSD